MMEPSESLPGAILNEWFCGRSSGNISVDSQLVPYYQGQFLNHVCLLNFYYTVFHLAFTIFLISTQCIIRYCYTNQPSQFLSKLPGHNIRWLIATLLLLIQIVAITEGVLTDSTRTNKETVSSYLYLYIPSVSAFFGGVCAIIVCHSVEVRWRKLPSIALTSYWMFSCGAEILRLINLMNIDLASFSVLRFDIVLLLLFIYATLGVIQIHHFRIKNHSGLQDFQSIPRQEDESQNNISFLRGFVSFPSDILHWWIHWLLRLGYSKPLTIEDLGCLPEAHLVAPNHQRLKTAIKEELSNAFQTGKNPSLLKVFWQLSWKVLLSSGLLRCFGEPFVLVTPFAISGIITYVNSIETHPKSQETFHLISLQEYFSNGFVLLVTIFVAKLIERLCLWTAQYMLVVESLHIRTAIQAAVYEKSLELSSVNDSRGNSNMGKITNCMSTDAANVLIAIQMIHFAVIPPMTLAALLLLFNTLGVSAVCGLAVCLVLFPIIVITSKRIAVFQKKALVFSDERVKHTHEMLKEMKLLKLNAWEDLFCDTIEKLRLKELNQVLYKNLVFAVAAFCSNTAPIMMTLVSFGTYTWLNDKPLTPEIAFPSLALFSLFDTFLFILPIGMSTAVTGYVSTKRIEAFLFRATGNSPPNNKMSSGEEATSTSAILSSNQKSESSRQYSNGIQHHIPNGTSDIEMKPVVNTKSAKSMNGAIVQSESSHQYSNGIQHKIPNGTSDIEMKPVVNTKSAKSMNGAIVQFLNCSLVWDSIDTEPVLKNIDVQIEEGKLTMVVGPVGCGKSAFLASILQDMIVINGDIKYPSGKPSIAFAAQRPWIQNATLRDNILCGLPMDNERYDDVISCCALDPDIDLLPAGDLTEIGERGINLSGGQKQRVNVARAIYSHAQILLLDDPLSALDIHVGSHLFEYAIMGLLKSNNRTVVLVTNQIQHLPNADKIIVLDAGHVRHKGTYISIVECDKQLLTQWGELALHSKPPADHSTSEMERNALQKQLTLRHRHQGYGSQRRKNESSKLIEKEEMNRGSVLSSVYFYLIRASGWTLVAFFIGFGIVQALYLCKDFWLAEWSEAGFNQPNETTSQVRYFIGGYAGLSIATIFVSVTSQLVHTCAAYTAGLTLHRAMLNNVCKQPIRFFDTNPLGRVLNRFSSDMNMIDMKLFRTIDASTYAIWKIIFCFLAITLVAPMFCIVAAIVGILYIILQRYYLKSSRELHRLESVSKSPIYAHFSETLNGLSTIRAFGFQKRFFNTLLQRIDAHSTAYLYSRTLSAWLNIRLDFMGAVVVLLAGLATLIGAVTSGISPALVALAIVYAQRASGSFGYLVKYLSDLEMHMNAVERIQHYTTLPTEQVEGFSKPSFDWPKHGAIRFEDVSVGYAKHLEPVLQHINLHFHSKEKIGICGRTGSGKSSLVLALFRCNIIFTGAVYIDDINTGDIPLKILRQQLAIIPQDPTLFTGTIRKNLDPEETVCDEDLWNALDIAQLKSVVIDLEGGLDAQVSESGDNLSVGQRQLFCLARAFLRKTHILIMDEATASIDTETAKILQDLLNTAFADRTVITIAHRVSSILESDRIVILDEGVVVEFDTPKNLLAKKDSMFAAIVHASKGGILAH